MSDTSDFKSAVHAVVKGIPTGKVMAYGDVASAAGFPGAARAVGSLMRQNYDETIPCHRVVMSNGVVGQYNREGGSCTKAERLRSEGVIFKNDADTHVDFVVSLLIQK